MCVLCSPSFLYKLPPTQDLQCRIWLNRSATALRLGQGSVAMADAQCVLQQCPEGHAMVPKALYRLGHVSRPLALCGVFVCGVCVCCSNALRVMPWCPRLCIDWGM